MKVDVTFAVSTYSDDEERLPEVSHSYRTIVDPDQFDEAKLRDLFEAFIKSMGVTLV